PIAIAALVVALAGLYVGGKITTQTDPERFVPSNSTVLKDLHYVRDVSGSTNELDLLVETSGDTKITDQGVLDWMLAFEQRQLQKQSVLGQSNSAASFTRSVTGEPPTTASAEDTLASAPAALRDALISDDGHSASITFAPRLPVVLALGASAMLLYFSGIEYSPLTSISGPLIIAMGTEFNVLLMCRYFEERGNGLPPREAMSKASLRIGRAIMSSGLTVMGGFAVLAFSDFPLLGNFGTVTALNIGLSLLSTLILLPPLLVWADEDRGYVGVKVERVVEQPQAPL